MAAVTSWFKFLGHNYNQIFNALGLNRQQAMPSMSAGNPTVTAAPIATPLLTEQQKINKHMAASLLTKDWMQLPKLSKPGLLGL